MNFSNKLISWYQLNKRDLPWRHTLDPYYIWLSEIILQQTRVNQGLPYYERFVETFPNVEKLAAAPQEEVLKLWQGLGYYSRARNLHAAAMQVVENGGKFPDSYADLLKLKGIGDYTAAAIASFAFNESVAVVDGNVYRVLSRIYGIATPINSTSGIKEFKKLAQKLIDPDHPAAHNQAIMEFGALQCVPKNPDCDICPFHQDCLAFKDNRIEELPVKIKKTKVLNLFHHYLVTITPSGKTVLQERPQSGIWAGLYEFPFVEASGALLPVELTTAREFKDVYNGVRFRESVYNQQPIIHKLSHRKIHAYFWIIHIETEVDDAINVEDARSKPLHILMERFMTQFWPQRA
ncbi:A/G-specific DNA-adenine glycosylase [Nonlabens sp. Hel1_33_55]|uniref:A/G-specific adenine glycosylase n=1 Tax=Nonlabens sp. Hel1_33_55 TaxID=1336802 RepID=UPI000875C0C7|nr:A/G-specific adenine glycosylase [Nonlabens sp. Hel1_33_55]SCY35942.1 A/G-specific DNA-adenine glycosylase [Nonlabens sp. Hel1_33_55]